MATLPSTNLRYATWGERFVCFFADIALVLPIVAVSMIIRSNAPVAAAILFALAIALWAYGRLLDGVRGQSPAKALYGFRVTEASTPVPIGPGRGLARFLMGLFFLVVLGPINYILVPLMTRKHQTLHDKAVGAAVIRDPNSRHRFGFRVWAWNAPAIELGGLHAKR